MSPRALQMRLNVEFAAGYVAAAVWGAAAARIVARVLGLAPWTWGAVLAAGLVLTARQVRRRGWSVAEAAVRLDRLANAGGLLLTLREVPDARWEPELRLRLQAARPPPLRVGRAALSAAAAAACVLAAGLLPQPVAAAAALNAAALTRVQALEEMERALAAEQPVADPLAEELDRLRGELEAGAFEEGDWEASDALERAMREAATARAGALERAEQAARRLARTLERAASGEEAVRERERLEEALASLESEEDGSEEGRQEGSGGVSPEDGGQAASGRGDGGASGQAAAGGQGASDGDGGQGAGEKASARGAGRAPSTRQRAEQLAEALRRRQEALSRPFQSGRSSQPFGGAARNDPGQGEAQGRARREGKAGEGGTLHGPAPDTPLRFGDETKFQKDRLGAEALPQHGAGDEGLPWGIERAAPPVNEDGRPAAPAGRAAQGADAPNWDGRAVPPRHRELVRRYFGGARRGE